MFTKFLAFLFSLEYQTWKWKEVQKGQFLSNWVSITYLHVTWLLDSYLTCYPFWQNQWLRMFQNWRLVEGDSSAHPFQGNFFSLGCSKLPIIISYSPSHFQFSRCGDILLAVNGRSISGMAHANLARMLKELKGKITLTIVSWPGTFL